MAQETVSVGPLSLTGQFFGAVSVVSSGFIGGPNAGILGMGFQALATDGKMPFVQTLIAAGVLSRDLFAFYLTRSSLPGSTVTLGGLDASHYTTPITYTPVTSQTYVRCDLSLAFILWLTSWVDGIFVVASQHHFDSSQWSSRYPQLWSRHRHGNDFYLRPQGHRRCSRKSFLSLIPYTL